MTTSSNSTPSTEAEGIDVFNTDNSHTTATAPTTPITPNTTPPQPARPSFGSLVREQYNKRKNARVQDDQQDNPRWEFAKDHAYSLVLLFVGMIEILLLGFFGHGMHDAYKYDNALYMIVGLTNTAVMVYPIVLAIRSKHHMVPRLVVSGLSVVLVWLLFLLYIRLSGMTGMAQATWSIPFIGSVLLPIGAVALHMIAASLLAKHEPKNEQQQTLVNEQGERDILVSKLNDANAMTIDLGAAVKVHTENRDTQKAKVESLVEESKKASKRLTKAQKKLSATRASMLLKKLQDVHSRTKAQRADTNSAVTNYNASNVDREKISGVQRDELMKMIKESDAELKVLIDYDETVRKRVEWISGVVKDSPEQKEVNKAQKGSTEVAAEAQAAQIELVELEKTLKKATDKQSINATAITNTDKRIKDIDAGKAESVKLHRGGWRDAAFMPALLLIIAFLALYPTWFGWMLVSFAS